MNKDVFRHELKYLINMPDYALLRARLLPLIRRDPSAGAAGEYAVRSLYFDDYWGSAYAEKEMGVMKRRKYRIRCYDCKDTLIRLERKTKMDAYVLKQSAPLTRAQVDAILAGAYAFLRDSEHPLLREFYCECIMHIMRPRVIVEYHREPFVMTAGDVRITFDKHIRAGMGQFSLFDPSLPMVEVLEGDRMVMEVKYTAFLPDLARLLLPPDASMLTAASKFVLACDAAVREGNQNRAEGLQWRGR